MGLQVRACSTSLMAEVWLTPFAALAFAAAWLSRGLLPVFLCSPPLSCLSPHKTNSPYVPVLLAHLPTSIPDPVHPAWDAFPFIIRTSTDQPVLPLPLGCGYRTSFSWWENSDHNIKEGLKCLHSGMSPTPLRISYHHHKICMPLGCSLI